MNIVIIGAGLAGSIAAGALSGYKPVILEAGPEDSGGLSGHYAVMRMRNPDIAKYLGCDSTEIMVDKAVYYDGCLHSEPSIMMNNLYSMKAYGQLGNRSLRLLGPVKRYLINSAQVKPANVLYNQYVHKIEDNCVHSVCKGHKNIFKYDICISTIPMPSILEVCGLNLPKISQSIFDSRPIQIITDEIKIPSTVHQTIYFPGPEFQIYRATLEGRRFLAEAVKGWNDVTAMVPEFTRIAAAFGLTTKCFSRLNQKAQMMGKIIPIADQIRKWIILELTTQLSIYSFGRFALWKPIRADDLVGDIEKIKTLVRLDQMGRSYEAKLSQGSE